MKIAIVHYWWFKTRGGEKVILKLLEMFPEADLFLHCGSNELIFNQLSKIKHKGKVYFSFINKFPYIDKYYQLFFAIMPFASETFNFDKYDVIISSESGPAKNIITPVDALHICYCHSPMRYIWDLKNQYLINMGFIKRWVFHTISYFTRKTDYLSSVRVDSFIANSSFIKKRIDKIYKRDSIIIHPPVDTQQFLTLPKKNYYLYFGELIEYKKPDLAIDAFNKLNKKLIVIGDGPMKKSLKIIANSNIQFLGRVDDNSVKKYLSQAKALIYPGIEDFGIIPVEAMASGTPVIAYKKGGVLDTILDGKTGTFFENQTKESLINAVNKFEKNNKLFSPKDLKSHANKFSSDNFKRKFEKFLQNKIK